MPMKAADTSSPPPSFRLKLSGTIARTLFILLLAVLTARVASPQVEKLRSVLETPDDLIRVVLGFAVCVWCIINLFILPKDAEAYRVWVYLGLAILPLSVLCAVVVW
jgi:hypothetical protein